MSLSRPIFRVNENKHGRTISETPRKLRLYQEFRLGAKDATSEVFGPGAERLARPNVQDADPGRRRSAVAVDQRSCFPKSASLAGPRVARVRARLLAKPFEGCAVDAVALVVQVTDLEADGSLVAVAVRH